MKHVIEDFKPLSGKHCITNSIKQIFNHYGHPMSEDMIFGLGSGLSWIYMEIKNVPFPIIGGRIKVLDFEENLANVMGISIKYEKTASSKKAYEGLKQLIEKDIPVMIYVDMPFLKYLNLPEDAHFGGHAIVVFGIDEEKGIAYVSDRDGSDNVLDVQGKKTGKDFHEVPLTELEKARGSKFAPFPAENKWFSFDMKNFRKVTPDMISFSIKKNAQEFLNPPIKNISYKGIKKFSESVVKWDKFDKKKLKASAVNSWIMISDKGGTGGGAFRKMYGLFLQEAAKITKIPEHTSIGKEYYAAGEQWDKISRMFLKIYEGGSLDLLKDISEMLAELSDKEKSYMEKLSKL